MYDWITKVRKILKLIYQYTLTLLIYNFLGVLFRQGTLGLKAMLAIAVIFVLSYILRDYFTRGVYLLIIHAVMGIIGAFFFSGLFLRGVILFTAFDTFMDGLFYINRGFTLRRFSEAPWELFLIGVISTILAWYLKDEYLFWFTYVATISLFINYLLTMYFDGIEKYISTNRHITGLPLKQIISVNSLLVTGIMFIVVVLVGLSNIFDFSGIVKSFGYAMLTILRIILIILSIIINLFFGLFDYGNPAPPEQGLKQIQILTQGADIIGAIIEFLLMALVTSLTVYLIYSVVRFFIKLILRKNDRSFELTEELGHSIRKKDLVRESTRVSDRPGRLSGAARVRELYRKNVLSFRKMFMPDRNDTAGDIEKALTSYGMENAEKFTEMYEAVRYGNTIPDRQYINTMKDLKNQKS